MSFTERFLNDCQNVLRGLDVAEIEAVAAALKDLRSRHGRCFVVGSGGGAGHASHACADFRKLCQIEAYAPYDNVSELTARVNDEGWETSLSNWLKVSNLTDKDVLFVFSVGGGSLEKNISMNLVNAVGYARQCGAVVLGIVGRDGGYTRREGNIVILIPTVDESLVTPLAEGMQALLWHLLVSHPDLQVNMAKWESTLPAVRR